MIQCNCTTCRHNLCARKVPIFSFLSDEELEKIVCLTINRDYNKRVIICSEGEKADSLFIINEGRVKLSKLNKEGKEQIIHIFSSGDFFGEVNLFSNQRIYNFTAGAVTDANICMLTMADMAYIIKMYPDIALKIMGVLAERLRDTENLVSTLATNDAQLRIALTLLEFAEKYGRKTNEGLLIDSPLSREELANYTGLTRETLSRKLKKLSDEEVIELIGTKKILLKDEDYLHMVVD